ncbi:MAG: maleylpyruvate isomerase N-terminal domain-containing protein [Candidatus Limnocylindria bacterium]
MKTERSYNEHNTRERERLRALVERLSDDDLRRKVNESWTVAAVLGHVAFWDARQLYLVDKLERGLAFTPAEIEPHPPDWINDSTRPLIDALDPRAAADLALRIAEQIDAKIAALPPDLAAHTWPTDPESLVNPLRAAHRGEHLDEIEAALAR